MPYFKVTRSFDETVTYWESKVVEAESASTAENVADEDGQYWTHEDEDPHDDEGTREVTAIAYFCQLRERAADDASRQKELL
jgi:hypothetical protein